MLEEGRVREEPVHAPQRASLSESELSPQVVPQDLVCGATAYAPPPPVSRALTLRLCRELAAS